MYPGDPAFHSYLHWAELDGIEPPAREDLLLAMRARGS